MKPVPYRLASFQGIMTMLVVDSGDHWVVALSNRVIFVDAVVWSRDEFNSHFKPVEMTTKRLDLVIKQFRSYAHVAGITPAGAIYLSQLTKIPKDELRTGLIKGMATQARIRKEAEKMSESNEPITGKAPRKLAGAAAAAVKRKEERLAAEAKQLAEQVTEDQNQAEKAGATDARLPKTPVKKSGGKGKPPKITKDTPPADKAKKVLNDKARSHAQVSADGDFDPAKLKNAEGKYKSASAMFKGLLYEGKLSDTAIAKAVDKEFGLGEQKALDYVKWNRGWFRRQGVKLPDPK